MSEEQQMCDVHSLSAEITCENGRARNPMHGDRNM
jgi:hypothetical protein